MEHREKPVPGSRVCGRHRITSSLTSYCEVEMDHPEIGDIMKNYSMAYNSELFALSREGVVCIGR